MRGNFNDIKYFYFGLIEGFEPKTCDVKVKKKKRRKKNFRWIKLVALVLSLTLNYICWCWLHLTIFDYFDYFLQICFAKPKYWATFALFMLLIAWSLRFENSKSTKVFYSVILLQIFIIRKDSLMMYVAQCTIGLIHPETCTVCDPFLYVTFTDFCHVVHQTKRMRS